MKYYRIEAKIGPKMIFGATSNSFISILKWVIIGIILFFINYAKIIIII